MKDYEFYLKTLLSLSDNEYTDNQQNPYDYDDSYQGCQSYYEYQEEWN